MKNYRILLISFVLFFFILGAVSATDSNSSDTITSDEEIEIGEENLDILSEDESSENQDSPLESNDIKEIYVNDTGDDANTGSSDSPYASISKALSDVSDTPATIYLSQGTFGKDSDADFQITKKLNTNLNNCNLTFIGAGADKTIINGQDGHKFLTITTITTHLTFKDITFTNFRGKDGAIVTGNRAGTIKFDNCIFKNAYSTNNGAAISYKNSDKLTITNSKFIDCTGGAIIASNTATYPGELYLENNTFVNVVKASGTGVAVSVSQSKTEMKNNRFINISGNKNQDAGVYLTSSSNPIIIDNSFTNCNSLSETYTPAYINANDNITFERNTFISSTNANNYSVFLAGNVFNLQFAMSNEELLITDKEIKEGVKIPAINVTDDYGNKVKYSGSSNLIFVGETCNFTTDFSIIPDNGIYDVLLVYNHGLSTTGVLTTAKVNISNEAYDIYVSPNGSNAGNGSLESPFKTIQHAIDVGFEKSFNVAVHLLEGIYSGDGNINLTLANKGNLKIIGEVYNKTIIDCENTNWFAEANGPCKAEFENLNVINGYSAGNTQNTLISGKAHLNNCIIDNNVNNGWYILYGVTFDNLIYTNNNGPIYYTASKDINNSYFANNDGGYKGLLHMNNVGSICISNCKFINNNVHTEGVIQTNGAKILSKNNYYADNYGVNNIVFKITNPIICENDTYFNNSASDKYGVGNLAGSTVINCRFIDNSATIGGVSDLIASSLSSFVNCSFINNSADYGGVFEVACLKFSKGDVPTIVSNFENCIFENNDAIDGKDIYLKASSINKELNDGAYLINLTITFNDIDVSNLSDVVSASVVGPNGMQVGGAKIDFMLDGVYIGSGEIVNGVATLKYGGFRDGNHVLSGNIDYPSPMNTVNNASVTVKLEGVVDHIDFWVSNSGSDVNGDGSEVNPFKTIQHAVDAAIMRSLDITIYLGEETYSGENNTNLTLPATSKITIQGKGIGKSIINGQNISRFADITLGENIITFSDLTIINMTPHDKDLTGLGYGPAGINGVKASFVSPIIVEKGVTLYLNNVNITECRGKEGIIDGEGNIFIYNSSFTKIGLANSIIKSENLVIENSIINQCILGGYPIRGKNILINNSEIIDVFNPLGNGFYLIYGSVNCIIENSKFLTNNLENPFNIIEIDYNDSGMGKATMIYSDNIIIKNSTFKDVCELMDSNEAGGRLNTMHSVLGGYNITVTNSSFEGYTHLGLAIRMSGTKILDGCLINVTKIDNDFEIINSVILGIDQYVGLKESTFENNYWGNNSQPVIILRNGKTLPSPSHWVILTSEGDEWVFKLTDGENVTDYTGSLPAKISYIDDEKGEVIPVVNINGDGYRFSVDETGNVILNTIEPIKSIVPKIPTDMTVFANDLTLLNGEAAVFVANFTDKWGDALKNVNVLFIIGDNQINKTTDENGSASFVVDFALGKYTVTLTNPGTGESIFRTISVITNDTISSSDVASVYGDSSKFFAAFKDEFGNPLINRNVVFKVGDNDINETTDNNGVASFGIDFNTGNYNVTVVNPVTGQNITKTLTVNKITTKLVAAKVTTTFNVVKNLVITLKDANNKALVKSKVVIKLNGKSYIKTTDAKGQVKLSVKLSANTYTATLTYAGDKNHIKSTASAKVVVKKAVPKMTAKMATFKVKNAKKYTITLKDNKGKYMKNVKVTLNVKGKKYIVKTNSKGQAIFKITNLNKKGKYTAKVTFAGNKNFKSATKQVKIIINK